MPKDKTQHRAGVERRKTDRTADDGNWEAKVLGRLRRRVDELSEPANASRDGGNLGWESGSVAVLRDGLKKSEKER